MTPVICARCGHVGAMDVDVRLALVNRHREQRRLGQPVEGPEYEAARRCMDTDACDSRTRVIRPAPPLDQEDPSWW